MALRRELRHIPSMNNASTPEANATTARLDALFQAWNRSDAPGAIVGIARDGATIYRRGFGLASVEHGIGNTPRTRMRIGSTSKHFASLATLLLAEDGKLDIDEALRRYLPELDGPVGEPSLRQLMQHSGGLRDPYDLPAILLTGSFPVLIANGAGLELSRRITGANFAPGERMIYCNNGYHLLSLVVERLSGLSFAQFLRTRILEPLGMLETQLLSSDMTMLTGLASFHQPQADGSWRRGIYPSEELLGSGGMVSNIDDMLRWMAHLRAESKVIGSAHSWAQMLERPRYSSGASGDYCLGLTRETYRGVEIIHHAGATLGCTTQMLTVPSHALDIIVIFNRMDGPASAMALKVLDCVLENAGLPAAPSPVPLDGHEALLGRWYSPSSRRLYGLVRHPATDQPPSLALSIQQQPMGAVFAVDAGLQMRSPSHGTVELLLDPHGAPPQTLTIVDSGHRETGVRLPDDAPPASALAGDWVGRYREPDFDRRFDLVLDDGVLYLDLQPLYGVSRFRLEPLSDEVCGCTLTGTHPTPLPTNACVSIERVDGRVTGLWLGSARTRNLWLERID
jgi:D-aminopeptidase